MTKDLPRPTAPEFSRLLAIEGIVPDKTRTEHLTARAEECEALARRLGVRSLTDLSAEVTIRRVSGGEIVRVAGRIQAEVVQECAVSLADVAETVDATFETFFSEKPLSAAEGRAVSGREVSFDADDEDAPEMLVDGMLDMGEVVAQYLSLSLNPYPRAPGVSLAAQLEKSGLSASGHPFAVLAGLKGKEKVTDKKDK